MPETLQTVLFIVWWTKLISKHCLIHRVYPERSKFGLDWVIKGLVCLGNEKPSPNTCTVARVKICLWHPVLVFLFAVPRPSIGILLGFFFFLSQLFISVVVQDLSSVFLTSSCLAKAPFLPTLSQATFTTNSLCFWHRRSSLHTYASARALDNCAKESTPSKALRRGSCRALCNSLNNLGAAAVYCLVQADILRQHSLPFASSWVSKPEPDSAGVQSVICKLS